MFLFGKRRFRIGEYSSAFSTSIFPCHHSSRYFRLSLLPGLGVSYRGSPRDMELSNHIINKYERRN